VVRSANQTSSVRSEQQLSNSYFATDPGFLNSSEFSFEVFYR
jgi:hypothetical protein